MMMEEELHDNIFTELVSVLFTVVITDYFGADAGLSFNLFTDQSIIKCKIYIIVGKAAKQHIDKIHLRVVCSN